MYVSRSTLPSDPWLGAVAAATAATLTAVTATAPSTLNAPPAPLQPKQKHAIAIITPKRVLEMPMAPS